MRLPVSSKDNPSQIVVGFGTLSGTIPENRSEWLMYKHMASFCASISIISSMLSMI